jgi:hypothetical protein
MSHFLKYKLVFGKPLPGNRFKPRGCIVNRNFAEEYRQGKCSLDQFDESGMGFWRPAIDPQIHVESYHLLCNSQLKAGENLPWGKIDPWFTKAYVDLNFEPCDHPAP